MSVVFFRLSRKNQRISHRNVELIKEQNHRVKNNLQVVSSLLSLQAKRLTDEAAKKAVEESRLRVQSMAIIHRKLYDGDKLAVVNLDEFIQELVNGVLKSFGYPFATVQYAIDTNSLSADKAIPLGLILNELITNACKYAFPQNENPHLTVRCYAQHAKLYLQVTDNGPGLEVPVIQTDDLYDPQTKSFGMSLIQAQVMQLNGTYQFSSADKTESTGTTFTMEFKL
ncbi:hypothetical protein GO730_18165 [Spirosoma sp. HMF3257]|uniref:histidine kinase n=1 Tax=Spirosoma telluris TaxID=2183553 RepID=A0A327NKA0_9BACT|nr:hypothetical protein [Spirosoma telluris]RAI75592.1 hypothetical protein HMF3257_18085 [Spirosoma telluris]